MKFIELYDGGAWEIVKTLSRKPTVSVYEVKNKHDKRRSALKVITIKYFEDDEDHTYKERISEGMLKETQQEYAIQDMINTSPNVVECLDHAVIGMPNGLGFYGVSRMDVLKDIYNESLSIEETVKMGKAVCRALMVMSSKKIMHRDVKPSNIFKDAKGDYRLGDFSSATFFDKKISDSLLVGTYGYIAPEIAMRKEYNETVDLYSLGCTLNNVSRGSRDDMSNELKYIFGKMCSSKPNSRYQSASEALKKLDNATLRRGKESKLVSLFYKGKLLSGEVHEFPANKLGLSDSTLGSGFDDGTVEPRKSDSGWQPVAFDYDNTFDERLKYGRYKNDKQPIESIETIEPKASIEPIEPKAPKKPNRAVPYGRVKEASIDKYDTTVAEWVFMREINNDIDVNKGKQTVINNIDVNNMFGRYNNDLE